MWIQSPNVFHILSFFGSLNCKGKPQEQTSQSTSGIDSHFPKTQLSVPKKNKHPWLEMNPLKLHQQNLPSPSQSQVLCFSVLVRSPRSPFLCVSFQVPLLACLCLPFCQCPSWPERKQVSLQLIPSTSVPEGTTVQLRNCYTDLYCQAQM